jgi:ABC-type multidrug transport system fused ATPase/permease subunit
MRDFAKSLRYLWPYRLRLALALVCTLLISLLWAAGLAAILPGAKVLLSPEGLHGWAYNLVVADRLADGLTSRMTPSDFLVEGQSLPFVLEVTRSGGESAASGLTSGLWLVGVEDGEPAHRLMRADALARLLAGAPGDKPLTLRAVRPDRREVAAVRVQLREPGLPARALVWAASWFREPQTYGDRFPMLAALLVAALIANILRDALRVLQEYLSTSAVLLGINRLRSDTFNVALRLPMSYFAGKGTSDTISRFIQDVGSLARGHILLLGRTLVEPAKAAASLVVALFLSWKLTLLALVAGPPAFLAIRHLGRMMRRLSRQALESFSQLLEVLQEAFTGIRVVKAYTMETAERKRFLRINAQLLQQSLKAFLIESTTAPVAEALGLTAAMGAVAVAGYWVLHGQNDLDAEKFLALMACLAAMFDPIRKLSSVSTVFHASDAAAARIRELHDAATEPVVPHAPSLPRHRRSIELRGVSVRYEGAGEDALCDVDLHIAAGENVAIVGPNGSGKTTLVSLLPRLLDPTRGRVEIDGLDIARHSLRSLRRQIGLVTQDAVLFHATIEENIACGLRRASHEKVLDAARRAYVDEFVAKLPQGYATMVGQHGATLSGGEKQRIAIARAILRDPAILIFDEAMSQIDSDSERRIQEAMARFCRGRTSLLIAHRFATVLSADRIVVLRAGRVVDVGPHRQLLERCAFYRDLYNTQLAATRG